MLAGVLPLTLQPTALVSSLSTALVSSHRPLRRHLRGSAVHASSATSLTVSTFNLLCPAYRRLAGESVREEAYPDVYMERNRAILELPLWESDIICAQEFWYANREVFDMYVEALQGRFRMHGLQRPGPDGGRRPDG